MLLDADQCFRALTTRDTRFDGRFFVGVGSTGIYCRPVCRARTPLRRNCRFFPSAAAAEHAGYRPCLRCRPELAPGQASVDANGRLARAAAGRLEAAPEEGESLARLAARLGVTDRHLRRVFVDEFGVAPVAYAQTQRLLLAKRLLTDTRLPIVEVALASGFSSLRRFNHLFRQRYRLTPSALRTQAPVTMPLDRLVFDLAYRPPYDWDRMLAFLERRAVAGVEVVTGPRYRRTVHLPASGIRGWLEVTRTPRRDALRVTLSASLTRAVPAVLARVKTLFDLECRPDELTAALGPLADARPGLRLPGAMDGFEIAVRAVLGQQVTVRAATTLAGRFAHAFGAAIDTPHEGLDRLFPAPRTIAALAPDAIAALGIIGARARAIHGLATALADGTLRLEPEADVAGTVEALQRMPGIGPWTAHYIAMRALAWPDAFPHPDVAVLKALGTRQARQALRAAEAWRPFRAYAVLHLWSTLESKGAGR